MSPHDDVYINGEFAWPQSQIARFPKIIRISVTGDPSAARLARCIDVETGAATPDDAAAFIQERHRLGFGNATVYCDESNVAAVKTACAGLTYRFWIASWTGKAHEVDNAWAVQYSGGPDVTYDTSIVYGQEDFSHP